jgi:HlyD family secretion protein
VTTSFGAEDSLPVPSPLLRGRSRRWRSLLIAAALLLLAGLVALLVWSRPRAAEVRYRTAPVARRTIASVVEASGKLDVLERVDVAAPQLGQLQRVLVREGQQVKAGDLLGELDANAAEIEVRGSSAGVAAASGGVSEARAALSSASDMLQRLERLQARDLAAEAEVASARANAEKARAALKAAEARQAVASQELAGAKLARGTLSLRAPIDGVVLRAPDWRGSLVRPEQGPLFVIGSALDVLRIDARVAEADIGSVRAGQRVTFTVPAFPGRSFEAELAELAVEAVREGNSVLYPVVLRAKNDDRALLPGMSARVLIRVAVAENVLAVRDAALRFRPDDAAEAPARPRVWISSEGSKARSVEVKTGVSDGAFTEIAPLRAGELGEGALVVIGKLKGTSEEQNAGPGISLRSKP